MIQIAEIECTSCNNIIAVPEGFEPMVRFPDGFHPELIPNEFLFKWDGCRSVRFYAGSAGEVPKLPFRQIGTLQHLAWSIPTLFALDADGRCFMNNNAQNHILKLSSESDLLRAAEDERDRAMIRKNLGKKPEYPAWVRAAKAAGWTPPATWDDSVYDCE